MYLGEQLAENGQINYILCAHWQRESSPKIPAVYLEYLPRNLYFLLTVSNGQKIDLQTDGRKDELAFRIKGSFAIKTKECLL